MEKRTLNQKQAIVDKWIEDHGAASFNLKEREIYCWDGGLFSIENKPQIRQWTRMKFVPEEMELNGKNQKVFQCESVPRFYKGLVTDKIIVDFIKNKINKGETFEEEVLHFFNKEKIDNIKAVFWFEDLDDHIKYLQSMKKMLKSLHYNTGEKS